MFKELNIEKLKITVPVFAAPLAGITDRPYREILRKCAPDVPILTEMISCHSLIQNQKNTLKTNCNRNFDDYKTEGLIGAQIFGADPEIMGMAAKILEQNGAKWIDINMGCPVPKVATRSGAGAFLMRDHLLAGRIISAVVRAVKIPVSIKTRLGWDNSHLDSNELVRIAALSGAKFATIHGRTRADGYSGTADWDKISSLKQKVLESLGTEFPIVFNGDIKTSADVASLANMGADGVMIGRAILGAPWVLGELSGTKAPVVGARLDIIMEHFEKTLGYYGARAGVPLFRKHAAWYSTGMQNASEFRVRVNTAESVDAMRGILQSFFVF